jgi:hypothetical protein
VGFARAERGRVDHDYGMVIEMYDGDDRRKLIQQTRAENRAAIANTAPLVRSTDWPPIVRERPQVAPSRADVDEMIRKAVDAQDKNWRDALHRNDATRRKDDNERREIDRVRIEASLKLAGDLGTAISEMREQIVQLRAEVTFLRAGLTELREKLPSP